MAIILALALCTVYLILIVLFYSEGLFLAACLFCFILGVVITEVIK